MILIVATFIMFFMRAAGTPALQGFVPRPLFWLYIIPLIAATAIGIDHVREIPRIFKATGAAGLNESLPFGGILADLTAGRQHISNQYEHVGSSWGAVMLGLENRDLMV